jgi:hypothetical protein
VHGKGRFASAALLVSYDDEISSQTAKTKQPLVAAAAIPIDRNDDGIGFHG